MKCDDNDDALDGLSIGNCRQLYTSVGDPRDSSFP